MIPVINTMQRKVLFLFLLCPPFWLQAQLLINEVCSDNETIITDEFGDESDWIELYNAGAGSVDLTGYFLSDNTDNPQKWTFPSISITPSEYLIIFASDENVLDTYAHTNFKLSKDGEPLIFSDPSGNVVDQIQIPALEQDNSYGRLAADQTAWSYYANPTPGAANDDASTYDFNVPPIFTLEQAFHTAATQIALTCEGANCTIRYTSNGSPPDETSEIYTNPILVDTTICIRARTFSDDNLPSKISTKTYFFNVDHTLPVMALSTDPYLLFDWEEGIFMEGPEADSVYPFWGANFWRDVEIPMHVEYFKAHELEARFDVGAKVHGGRASRTKPQKSLRLFADAKFGDNEMTYKFFENRDNDSFKRLVLRNASGDFNYTHCRDAYMQRYFIDQDLDLDELAYQPLAIYLNGRYWGVLNLREKVDKYYLRDNYGVDIENIDLLEEDTFAVEGSFEIYDAMLNFIKTSDMTDDGVFAEATKTIDLENIADYMIVQNGLLNIDWPNNNIKYWREKKDGAKWRYILFDMDSGMGRATDASFDSFFNIMTAEWYDENNFATLFRALMRNIKYRNYFLNRYADIFNTTLRTENAIAETDRTVEILEEEMFRHFQIWTWPGYDVWKEDRLPGLYDFFVDRPTYARQHLMRFFELENEVHLKFNAYPPEAGTIEINTISVDELPWDGHYFNGVPVKIKVVPNAGYTFQHWASVNTILTPDASQQIELNFSEDDEITAFFEAASTPFEISISPNPVEGMAQVQFVLDEVNSVMLNLYDVSGRLLQSRDFGRVAGGVQQLEFDVSDFPAGVYMLEAKTPEESFTVKVLVL